MPQISLRLVLSRRSAPVSSFLRPSQQSAISAPTARRWTRAGHVVDMCWCGDVEHVVGVVGVMVVILYWQKKIWIVQIVSVFVCFSCCPAPSIEAAYLKKKYAPGLLDSVKNSFRIFHCAIFFARQQQLAYVEEAHKREQPPLEAIAAPEILRGELCGPQVELFCYCTN